MSTVTLWDLEKEQLVRSIPSESECGVTALVSLHEQPSYLQHRNTLGCHDLLPIYYDLLNGFVKRSYSSFSFYCKFMIIMLFLGQRSFQNLNEREAGLVS